MGKSRAALVAVIALAALAFDAAFATRHGFFDLKVYFGAINWWAHGHGELYDYLKPNSTYGFTYPPFAAFAMLPMAIVPWPVAITIASVLTIAATVLVVWWLVRPLVPRDALYAAGITLALLIAYEPMRETFLFGQVNMLLVALVAGDLLFPTRQRRWWAGIGIGLATAIKLTPGLFIIYLLVTRRFRAAGTAMATAAGVTLVACAIAPDAAREFFTNALWDTDRVGSLAFVSNQSLQGLVARLDPAHPSKVLWLVLVLAAVAVWIWKIRQADLVTGLALTGVVSCLLSPVTWIHHLVWLVPAFVLLVRAGGWRFRLAAVSYVILCSKLVWVFDNRFFSFWGYLGSNAYVFITVVFLFAVPSRSADDAVAQLGVAGAAAGGRPDLADPVRP
ncbi:glycosyltransferase 87 family protein [Hamadaea tsunoensis]|uniref:glycosyltransferase 87 family protein n=1 Tax=Hamadaea tsunoensis TaxID=53368 RepID=UPI000400AABE|nr:glycosyltransferase 87 family protein [Hamadaea tsunoensis]